MKLEDEVDRLARDGTVRRVIVSAQHYYGRTPVAPFPSRAFANLQMCVRLRAVR